MTTAHKAAPKQWAEVEDQVKGYPYPTESCLLELRARVEALEAAQRPSLSKPLQLTPEQEEEIAALLRPNYPAPLVEQVRDAISSEYDPKDYCWDEARLAIRKVAEALQQSGHCSASAWLLKQL